jgi:spermidine synthase
LSFQQYHPQQYQQHQYQQQQHPQPQQGFSNKSVLYHEHSGIQSILVFKSAQYGNVLVLDGVIQVTERDEFAYHEMMAHIPLNAHANPKRVLIVGGGDGGILREVCKHDTVEEIVLVEIDKKVIEVALQFFGESTALKVCFEDPRLRIVHADGADFLASHDPSYYDVIIGDTSDPVGPAESLCQPDFYESMYDAVKEGGIVCMDTQCFWTQLDLISDIHSCCSDIFGSAEYATTMLPTYPCGQIGFILTKRCDDLKEKKFVDKHRAVTCSRPIRNPAFLKKLKWYSPRVHEAAFVLPVFVSRRLGQPPPPINGVAKHDVDKDQNGRDKCFLDGLLQLFKTKVGSKDAVVLNGVGVI